MHESIRAEVGPRAVPPRVGHDVQTRAPKLCVLVTTTPVTAHPACSYRSHVEEQLGEGALLCPTQFSRWQLAEQLHSTTCLRHETHEIDSVVHASNTGDPQVCRRLLHTQVVLAQLRAEDSTNKKVIGDKKIRI